MSFETESITFKLRKPIFPLLACITSPLLCLLLNGIINQKMILGKCNAFAISLCIIAFDIVVKLHYIQMGGCVIIQ